MLQVVKHLAFSSDAVAQKIFTKDVLKSLELLCAHKNREVIYNYNSLFVLARMPFLEADSCFYYVQRLALLVVRNLASCLENRQQLVTSESLQELLIHLTAIAEPRVNKAADRALAILGLFGE